MELHKGKYLTFTLGNEEYGIPILQVKEIIGLMDITVVPRTPGFIKGVINLRGKIIPILDLRIKFGMSEKKHNERTCIIVVEIYTNNTKNLMGVVVDTVSEVVNIPAKDIEEPPQYGAKVNNNFLIGMGQIKEKVIMLLNIEEIINNEEMINLLSDMKGNSVNV